MTTRRASPPAGARQRKPSAAGSSRRRRIVISGCSDASRGCCLRRGPGGHARSSSRSPARRDVVVDAVADHHRLVGADPRSQRQLEDRRVRLCSPSSAEAMQTENSDAHPCPRSRSAHPPPDSRSRRAESAGELSQHVGRAGERPLEPVRILRDLVDGPRSPARRESPGSAAARPARTRCTPARSASHTSAASSGRSDSPARQLRRHLPAPVEHRLRSSSSVSPMSKKTTRMRAARPITRVPRSRCCSSSSRTGRRTA